MSKNLGSFIRAHRERIRPEDVGLPASGRRRTPGLRRDELALMCDVSTTWLTWIEQGRRVSASSQALSRLAEALCLTGAERAHLFHLAGRLDPLAEQVHESEINLRTLVDSIGAPAYVLDQQWNAIAWNDSAGALLSGWLGLPTSEKCQPNLLRYIFLDARSRSLIVDWDVRARRLVAEFRAEAGKRADLPPFKELVQELSGASERFRELWNQQDVATRQGGRRRFHHQKFGLVEVDQMTLHPATRPDLKVVVLLPEIVSDA